MTKATEALLDLLRAKGHAVAPGTVDGIPFAASGGEWVTHVTIGGRTRKFYNREDQSLNEDYVYMKVHEALSSHLVHNARQKALTDYEGVLSSLQEEFGTKDWGPLYTICYGVRLDETLTEPSVIRAVFIALIEAGLIQKVTS